MWLEPFLLSEVYFSVVSWFEPHFFMVVSYLHRLHSISNQQSATSHAGTARWGEKAWQSIESQPTEMLGVWCHPYKPADQGDHPATRFHQEKIRPPKKNIMLTLATFVSHMGYLLVLFYCIIRYINCLARFVHRQYVRDHHFLLRRKNMELEATLPIEVLQDCWWYLGCIFHAFEGLQNQALLILHTTMQFNNSQITFHGIF